MSRAPEERRAGMRGAAALALVLLAAALGLTALSNNDVWLHLRTGALILERGAVPRVEEYSFTRAGTPLVDHEWGAQVVLAAVERAAGTDALSGLQFALVAGTLLLVWSAARRGAGASLAAEAAAPIVAAGAGLLLATHLLVRPHLFSFLLAAAFVRLLPATRSGSRRERRRSVLALLALQLLWVNLHGGFVTGILLAGLHGFGRAVERRDGLRELPLPAALLLVSLANPYGWRIFELVAAFGEPAFRELVVEWRSPLREPFAFSPLFWLWVAWLVALLAAIPRALRLRRWGDALTALAFVGLSLASRRHVSLLGVVTAPLLADALAAHLGARSSRAQVRSAWGAVLLPGALAAAIGWAGLPWEDGGRRRVGFGVRENMPREALDALLAQGLRGRVFCSLPFGAYVTWAGWPALTTFVDSRLEVFGAGFLREYQRALRDPAIFRALAQRDPFDLALLAWQTDEVAGPVSALAADPAWSLVYFDDLALLYVRQRPERAQLLAREAFRAIDPVRYVNERRFAPGAPLAEVEREARRAIAAARPRPGRPALDAIARILLASALEQQGRRDEARAELRATLAAGPVPTVAYLMLGTGLLELGDREAARVAWEELAARVPDFPLARRMLQELTPGPREPGGRAPEGAARPR